MVNKKHFFLFYAISALVLTAPFVFTKSILNYATMTQTVFIQVGAVSILTIFMAYLVISGGRIQISKHPLNLSVIVFLTWTLFLSFFAHNRYESFTTWSQWAACGLVFFMLQQVQLSKEKILQLLAGIYIAGVIVSIIGISQYLFQFDMIPQSAPPSVTFGNKNIAAQFIVLTFPITVLLFKKHKWSIVLGSALMLAFLYFTHCSAAWVAVASEIGIIVFVLTVRHRNKAGIVFIAILFLFGAEFIGQKIEGQSGQQRIDVWANTIEMIKDRPIIGYGPGNFKVYYPKYQKYNTGSYDEIFNEKTQIERAHNDFLQFTAEAGLIGFVVLLTCIVLFFTGITKVLRKDDDRFYIALCVGVAVAGVMVNSCFSFPGYMPIPPLFIAIYFAVGLSLFETPLAQSSQIVTPLLLALFIPGLIFFAQYQYKTIQQNKYYKYAKYFERGRSWKKVLVLADKGYSLNQHNKKLLALSGRSYIELGQVDKGINALEEVAEAYPYKMNTLLNLGVGYNRSGQEEKALECFDRVLDIKPDFAKAYINIAMTRLKLNQNKLAVVAFQKAKAIAPEYFEANALEQGERK